MIPKASFSNIIIINSKRLCQNISAAFSDLSHHRTCGSAYGGSLFYVQSDIVVHKTGIAREPEFIIGRRMVHYTLRICPIPLAAIPIYACPIGIDSAFDEIGNPRLWV